MQRNRTTFSLENSTDRKPLVLKEALTENYVASELVKKGYTLHYYDRKSRQELDFLIAKNNKIVYNNCV